jgi:hypothetical protein
MAAAAQAVSGRVEFGASFRSGSGALTHRGCRLRLGHVSTRGNGEVAGLPGANRLTASSVSVDRFCAMFRVEPPNTQTMVEVKMLRRRLADI